MSQTSTPQTAVVSHTEIDLEAYFRRIKYQGPQTHTHETFRGLHVAHVNALPFENLNPLCGFPVRLDPASIQQKLVYEGRGGYCFEHNHLFMHVLRKLGFNVKPLAARAMWNVPEGVVTARGHMLLLVTIDGIRYISDTGFGGLTLPVPILLETEIIQETTHEHFRLVETANEFYLQASIRDQWMNLYRFTLEEQLFADYEVANYYHSTNLNSHFTYSLIAARIDGGKRYTLRNNEFSIHERGETSRRVIDAAETLMDLLRERFLIRLPESETLANVLEALVNKENPQPLRNS